MNKQTVYKLTDASEWTCKWFLKNDDGGPYRFLNELESVYVFTKEELEAHDSFTINVTDRYYPVLCQTCGWVGSSSELEGGGAIADTGDHFDCYCPVCGQIDPDECEPVQPISIYKDAALKMGNLLKQYIQLNEENHWDKMSKTIEMEEYANQKKNEWQREVNDWFYPEKGEYPEMVENENYSLNVLAEVEGMNDIQVMCYCYIPGEDGGFIWANCDKKLDGDAEFDDNYIVKKWKPIPVI